MRQGASVRRHPLRLGSRLISEIGAAEEPVLGFTMQYCGYECIDIRPVDTDINTYYHLIFIVRS